MTKGPSAQAVCVTDQQREILERIGRARASRHSLVQHAQIVVSAADGMSNAAIRRQQGVGQGMVQQWRRRWQANVNRLKAIEANDEDELAAAIREVLSDQARSGTPGKFSAEQQVQIVAVACEDPHLSGRPSTHWTPRELADEPMK